MAHSLTDAQRNYSQLEKEALALVTAVERFHKFVWGRKFILQTDHKPLVALLQTDNSKGLKPTTAARLKRWAIRLLGYDFKIENIHTQDFGQADALSRLIDNFRHDNAEELQVARIQDVESELLQIKNLSVDFFDKELWDKLKLASKECPTLRSVFLAIKQGWKTKVSPDVEPYKKRAEDLSIVDDTLLLGDRIVIPEKLRPLILDILHKGHPGIRRTKQLAREYVYWPKMAVEIERLIHQCDPCAVNQKLPVKVPLSPWPTPTRPMERVHLNYAGPIDGQYLLIFVDAFSKFIDVAITPTISANRTADICRDFFCRYGPPDILVTDHGTQFTSETFAALCKDMQISHLLSLVNHPQSNGQAERMVDTIKRAIAKNPSDWKQQLYDFLYSYRYTSCSTAFESKAPADFFFGRRMNSPFTKWFPRQNTLVTAPAEPSPKQQAMTRQFSKHHGTRPRHLTAGDPVVVLIRKDKREQGTIIEPISKYQLHRSLPSEPPKDQDDGWIFYQPPQAPVRFRVGSLVSSTCYGFSYSRPRPGAFGKSTGRPVRDRVAPRRLVLNPSAKSYAQGQVFGTPMGSPLSPILADIVMQDLEESVGGLLSMSMYYRYVDDILIMAKREEVEKIFEVFNSYHDPLKFTMDYESDRSINFLDLSLNVVDNKLILDWFHKKTFSEIVSPLMWARQKDSCKLELKNTEIT
ncbi:PREDICTED: uncharacterized protein K02A2.6-like [Cyphomyrmex costatus]|uniref:uncharacterized protein K02A2.6-like n=1 Tax=Cyphomyrmex costatus TaxID=456900 RepID=UPI0008523E22|nr:PREDICTED: uncharacterized protein K02A2.6-like [Cyphomyrmex costatus]